jgi:hypothetical protein
MWRLAAVIADYVVVDFHVLDSFLAVLLGALRPFSSSSLGGYIGIADLALLQRLRLNLQKSCGGGQQLISSGGRVFRVT